MKTRILISAIFASTLILACGSGSSGDGGRDDERDVDVGSSDGNQNGPASDDQAPAAAALIDCATQWREKVAKAPVGQVQVHDILEVTSGSGDPAVDRTVRAHSREEVVSATDTEIVITSRWEYFEPALGVIETNNGMTKENFMFTCEPMPAELAADPEGLVNAGITILADREESVDVRAGTFTARFQKIHVDADDGLDNEVLGEHWSVADESVIVKEKIVVTSTMDGITTTKVTERELVEFTPQTPEPEVVR